MTSPASGGLVGGRVGVGWKVVVVAEGGERKNRLGLGFGLRGGGGSVGLVDGRYDRDHRPAAIVMARGGSGAATGIEFGVQWWMGFPIRGLPFGLSGRTFSFFFFFFFFSVVSW